MQTALKIFLAGLFGVGCQILLLLLAFRLNGFTPESLKTYLKTNNTYVTLSQNIANSISQPGDSNSQADDLVAPFIKQVITPDYLQTKTEKFIDDTAGWMQDKTQNPPVISFIEIKQAMLAQNPDLINQLNDLSKQMKDQQAAAAQQSQGANSDNGDGSNTTDQTSGQTAVPSFDITTITKSNFEVPVGQNLAGVKNMYQLSQKALPIIAILLVGILGLIVLLSDTLKSKIRWVGVTLLIAVPYGIIPLLASMYLSTNTLPLFNTANQNPITAFFQNLGDLIVKATAQKWHNIELPVLIAFAAGGILLIIVAKSLPAAAKPVKTAKK